MAALRSFVERLQALDAEKAALTEDMRELFHEAKANGYDPKMIKVVLKLLKLSKDDREKQDEIIEKYLEELNM